MFNTPHAVQTGKCANLSTQCCAKCNSHDLALSGINATGALGVLNLYSCDTGVQRITRHSAAEASVLRYRATWHGLCDVYRGGVSTRILGRRTAPFPPLRIPYRVPHGFTPRS